MNMESSQLNYMYSLKCMVAVYISIYNQFLLRVHYVAIRFNNNYCINLNSCSVSYFCTLYGAIRTYSFYINDKDNYSSNVTG